MDKTQEQIPVLVKERDRVYKQISRCKDKNRLAELVQQRDMLTEAIGKLRKDLKNARAVMERSANILQRIQNNSERTNETRNVRES